MAKGKPNLAFLEALNKDKRRRGDPAPGGVFRTPEWFNKTAATPDQPQTKATTVSPMGTMVRRRGTGFHLTGTRIAGGVMVVLIVLMGGYIALRKPAPPKLSASTETVRSAPAQGNVMDVPAGHPAVSPPAPIPVVNAVTPPAANAAQQASPGNTLATGPRTIGLNYVVFQSYKDKETATEAKDALVAGGIGATVEKGHPYAPTWYVVIGTQGFVNPNTGDFLKYISKSKAISEKFAGKNKRKPPFEPNPYRWR
jgi:hypothetical protein